MNPSSLQARATLATLPLSFPEPTGVVFVDGDPSWPAKLLRAMRSGATAGIVLVRPAPVEFAELLGAEPSTPVVIDSPWVSNPTTGLAAQAFGSVATSSCRVECRVVVEPGADFATALLDQMVLIRTVLGQVTQLRIRHVSERALHADGLTDTSVAIDFTIVGTAGLPSSANLRLLTPEGSVELLIPSTDTAQPARLTTVGPAGAVLAPTHYETSHRASLRRLRELQATGSADGLAELRRLHADVLLTTAAFGDHLAAQAPA